MNFPYLSFELQHSPDQVRTALMTDELEPFFARSGWFAEGGAARAIRWQSQADGSLVGQISYFRAKNLSAFRFVLTFEPTTLGSKVLLRTCHGPYSPILRVMLYVVGLSLCCVGIVFSYLGDRAIQRALRKVVESLQRHLSMWDR